MKIRSIEPLDIDQLSELQPGDWSDIRPYFYYYTAALHCDPIKITDNGEIVAVGTTIWHQDSSWLAHIIVHPNHRGKGLGKTIASSLLNRIPEKYRRTIYLDATEMGYPVYKKLGFETETEYVHLQGQAIDLNLNSESHIVPFQDKYRKNVLELDEKVSCEQRLAVLNDHLPFSLLALENGELQGAYFPTLFDGYIAALTENAGQQLMKIRMRSRFTSRIPAGSLSALNFLQEYGYNQTAKSRRMILGQHRQWRADLIFNRISGGLG